MAKINYKNVDISDLQQGFQELSRDLQQKAGFAAAASGSRVVQKEAIRIASTIPSGKFPGLRVSGALLENIAIARQKALNGGTYFPYNIGVRHGGKKHSKTGRNPWYWWLLEFGWTDKKGQQHRYPFITPAIQSSPGPALEAVRVSLRLWLARFQNRRASEG